MANPDHVAIIKKGCAGGSRAARHRVEAWNAWRDQNPDIIPDLSGEIFHEANINEVDHREGIFGKAELQGVDFHRANLSRAYLAHANLTQANLIKANLTGATLSQADLVKANLTEANLFEANLFGANLFDANLTGANIRGADLEAASLLNTDLTGADLTGCRIHGLSAWGLKLDESTKQQNLVITRWRDEPEITIDNIEVAQFIYLLLHNQKIRDVIDTIGKKCVLLLGRFTEGRIEILERLREKLRSLGYVPMVFSYSSVDRLIEVLEHKIVRPAEAKANHLLAQRTEQLRIESV